MLTLNAVPANTQSESIAFQAIRSFLPFLNPTRIALLGSLFLAVACSDSPTAPSSIDRAAADRVLPSLIDARTRLAPSIQNTVIRERTMYDLQQLEQALTRGDGQLARFHVRVTSKLLNDYQTQKLATTDAADVTAIALMLRAVSQAVGGDFDIAAFP